MSVSKGKLETKPLEFETPGKSEDEIVLEFGDGEGQLFISRYVLCRASPVFKAMFTHSTQEAAKRSVKIEDITIQDFNELLLCIDPGTQKAVTDRNVLKLTPLSHKYLMAPLSERCKDTLTIWLEKLRAKSCRDKNSKDKRTIRQMLTILKTAADFDLDSVVALAANYLASFSCSVYINRKHSFDEECSKIYFSLPDRVRMKVAELRLSHTENEQFVD